ARLANQERARTEKLYHLARNILLLDQHEPAGPQIAESILTSVQVRAVALFDAPTATIHTAGAATKELEEEVRNAWVRDGRHDDPAGHRWSRILRLGRKGIGAITLEAQHLNPLEVDGIASMAAVAFERARSLEKEALAEAARQSEQLRATVLDALAHAFKTPLTAIMASSSGLLEAGSLGAQERELVNLIDNEAVHLNDLATRLLQTARLDMAAIRLKKEGCTLECLIAEVLAPFSDRFDGRSVEVSVTGGDVVVSGDCELIATAISQLVDNAVKYSDPDTKITLKAEARGKEVIVSVHNIGPAIRQEDRERIFERFYRSKGTEHRAAGTGLGLSITKKIAEAHGGRVWVSGSELRGTTFFFAIPLEKMEAL
ncbi:MAG TPA: ATP-binding protein, partial [Bryobacteraceae bacterium]|nr:ATP-binding protein [Bryobacteraceae bacterium]